MACWSYFAKKLLAQPLLFPRTSCRFLNPDLAVVHYTVFLQLLLWSAEYSVSWQVSLTQLLKNRAKTEMPNCWWDAVCLGGTSQPWSMRVKLVGPVWS